MTSTFLMEVMVSKAGSSLNVPNVFKSRSPGPSGPLTMNFLPYQKPSSAFSARSSHLSIISFISERIAFASSSMFGLILRLTSVQRLTIKSVISFTDSS